MSAVPLRALVPFLLIAFGLAWGIFAALILYTAQIVAWFGEISAGHPLFILAVYAPAIGAFILVGWYGGMAGVGRFLGRLLLWRCAPWWYLFLILGVPAIYYAGAVINGTDLFAPLAAASLGAVAFMLVLGPLEEFGWRGLALPLLQRVMAPFWAGIVLGLIWGVWHLPAFFLSGTPQSAWGFMPFLIGAVAISVIMTPLFNQSGGSLLLPALLHFQLNNPLWPDAQPYDSALFVLVAALIVWMNRTTLFDRQSGVVTVIPADPRRRVAQA